MESGWCCSYTKIFQGFEDSSSGLEWVPLLGGPFGCFKDGVSGTGAAQRCQAAGAHFHTSSPPPPPPPPQKKRIQIPFMKEQPINYNGNPNMSYGTFLNERVLESLRVLQDKLPCICRVVPGLASAQCHPLWAWGTRWEAGCLSRRNCLLWLLEDFRVFCSRGVEFIPN